MAEWETKAVAGADLKLEAPWADPFVLEWLTLPPALSDLGRQEQIGKLFERLRDRRARCGKHDRHALVHGLGHDDIARDERVGRDLKRAFDLAHVELGLGVRTVQHEPQFLFRRVEQPQRLVRHAAQPNL